MRAHLRTYDVREWVRPRQLKEKAMYVDRFVRAELVVEREQPMTHSIEDLLVEAGLAGDTQETLVVISYDSINQIRTIQEIARGGYHELKIPIAPLLTAVLLSGTDRFTVAHNHPSGDTSPTMADVDLTHMVMAAANAAGLFFDDHLIIGPGVPMYSMLEHGLIIPSPKAVEMATGRDHRRATGD
jgi:DNA repair protein RadC